MLIERVDQTNARRLFDYWSILAKQIPYFFQVDFDQWVNCLFHDTRDSETIFKYTEEYMVEENGIILGFIQFGQPNFHWNSQGEKYANPQIGVIRNIYYNQDRDDVGEKLIELAEDYFIKNHLQPCHAFFHAMGMTCNAGHGKLHNNMFHIEQLLKTHGFEVEHENVYYRININNYSVETDDSISIDVRPNDMSHDQKQYFKLIYNDLEIGGAQVTYLRNISLVYLNWIWIKEGYSNKGIGSVFIRKLFKVFAKQGYILMDTDTAHTNVSAQKYYEKNGFTCLGVTRSYLRTIKRGI